MSDDEAGVIVFSDLGGRYTRAQFTVEVLIYRGDDEKHWILEVEDPAGGSTVWDDRFATDEEALAEFRRALKAEGIKSFILDERDKVH